MLVTDDSLSAPCVVVLYRSLDSYAWQKVELTYSASSHLATGTVNVADGRVEYFVQAADAAGNVAWLLEHGNPFNVSKGYQVYLPIVLR